MILPLYFAQNFIYFTYIEISIMKSVVMNYQFRYIMHSTILNIDMGLNDDYRNRVNTELCKYCKSKYPLCMKKNKFQTNVKIKENELDCTISYCSMFDIFYIY